MSRRVIGFACAALALCVLWLAWPGADAPAPERPVSGAEQSPAAPANAPLDASDVVVPTPKPDEDRQVRAATPTFVLRAYDREDTPLVPGSPDRIATGRVAWQRTGEPIADCTVSLTRLRLDTVGDETPATDSNLPDPEIAAVTDRFGRFELAGVPEDDELYLRFRLPDGSSDVDELRIPVRDDEPTWQGEYLLEERGTIVGRMSRWSGNAEIRAVDEFRYDQDRVDERVRKARQAGIETFHLAGTDRGIPLSTRLIRRDRKLPFPRVLAKQAQPFTLHGVRAGAVVLLVGGAATATRIPVLVEPFQTTDVGEIRRSNAWPLRVRLVDHRGKPLRAFQISAHPSGERFGGSLGHTDRRGNATLAVPTVGGQGDVRFDLKSGKSGGSLGQHYLIRARKGAGEPWEIVGSGESTEIQATWPERASVTVELDDVTAAECEAAQIRIRPRTRTAEIQIDGTQVAISNLSSQGTTVAIQIEGRAPVLIGGAGAPIRPGSHTYRVRPADVGPAEIVVTDPEGAPWARARIAAEFLPRLGAPRGSGAFRSGPLTLGRTDENGRLELPALWRSRIRFHVQHPEIGLFREAEPTQRDPGTGPIELVVDRPGRIEGEVVDNGAPAGRRFRVRIRRPADSGLPEPDRVVESTLDGLFQFSAVRPGPWDVALLDPPAAASAPRIVRSRRIHASQQIIVGSQRTAPLLFDLAAQGTGEVLLRGRVRFGNGPLDGLRLRAVGPGGDTRALPDTFGEFAFHELPHPAKVLCLEMRTGDDWVPIVQQQIRGGAGGTREPIDFDVQVGSLTIALFDRQGNALARRMVDLERQDGRRLGFLTDATGTLEIPALPAGEWFVEPRSTSPDRNAARAPRKARRHTYPAITVVAGQHTVRDLQPAR